MNGSERLVRIALEITCRVEGDVDDALVADALARQVALWPFALHGARVAPTTLSTSCGSAAQTAVAA